METTVSDHNAFNHAVIEEFRAHEGKLSGRFTNRSLLLLTTVGARSGQPRTCPLAYIADGQRLIVIAAKAGAPSHPDWYRNLLVHPVVTVEVGNEHVQARARVATGEERTRLFEEMVAQTPAFAEYQDKTERQLPVIVLERLS